MMYQDKDRPPLTEHEAAHAGRMHVYAERFWARVAKSDGCWIWRGYIEPSGYGQAWWPPKRRCRQSHQVAWFLTHGEWSTAERPLDHLCRNPSCVNPEHLELVTPRVNNLRGESFAARNARKTHCKRGHEFTPENIYVWKRMRKCKTCSFAAKKKSRALTS